MKLAILILMLIVIVMPPAFSAESTVGKWRTIEVAPDPVYPRKAGKFVSKVGMLEITTPECFALWPEGEDEGQDPAKTNHLYAPKDHDCKDSKTKIKSVTLLAFKEKPISLRNCRSIGFASELIKTSGREACLSAKLSNDASDPVGDIYWELLGSCPKTNYTVTIIRHEQQSAIDEMKKTRAIKAPPDIQALIESIHCLDEKK